MFTLRLGRYLYGPTTFYRYCNRRRPSGREEPVRWRLWKVSDEQNRELIEDFYRRILSGQLAPMRRAKLN
jgi:hypothetical protein